MNKNRRLDPAGQGGGFSFARSVRAAATTAYMIGL
jgi:hypothetical protein